MKNQKHSLKKFFKEHKSTMIGLICLAATLTLLYDVTSNASTRNNEVKETITASEDVNLYAGVSADLSSNLKGQLGSVRKTPMSGFALSTFSQLQNVDIACEKNQVDAVASGQEEEPQEDIEAMVIPTDYECNVVGYTTSNLNIRSLPNTDSEVIEVLGWNNEISYAEYDDDWLIINYNDGYAFVNRSYVTNEPINYTYMDVSGDQRKSYMDYRCITSPNSKQKNLQDNYAYTEANGVRAVNGRYCIALGSYFTHNVGQYVDLILENGCIIPAIIGDCKKNVDTDSNHQIGADGGVAEFIVQTESLSDEAKFHGDVSYATSNWNSKVVGIRIYDNSLF